MVPPERQGVIRLARPDITDADIAAVADVLRTGHLVQGKTVQQFEHAIAEYTDGGEVAAVCNGTATLHLALLALGIGQGHRVGVPTYSWPATANAVVVAGATRSSSRSSRKPWEWTRPGKRDSILARLKDDGIEANIGTYDMPLISYYRRECGFRAGDFPVTDAIAAAAIALPMHSFLSSADQEQVADSLRRAISS